MKIRVISDMHCEFSYLDLQGDKDTILILAGDIFVGTRALREEYIPKWSKMFKYVIYVLGNHEYYRHNIDTLPNKIRKKIRELGLNNVYLLDDDLVELDGVQFAGTTLWTDFNKGDPMAKIAAKFSMNDYKQIRAGTNYRKLDVLDVEHLHFSAMLFLKSVDYSKPTVVITHHAPHVNSIDHNRYGKGGLGSELNYSYFTDLEEFIREKQPLVWVFGHTHKYTKFNIDNTLIYSNPRGYEAENFSESVEGFDPLETLEIQT